MVTLFDCMPKHGDYDDNNAQPPVTQQQTKTERNNNNNIKDKAIAAPPIPSVRGEVDFHKLQRQQMTMTTNNENNI